MNRAEDLKSHKGVLNTLSNEHLKKIDLKDLTNYNKINRRGILLKNVSMAKFNKKIVSVLKILE